MVKKSFRDMAEASLKSRNFNIFTLDRVRSPRQAFARVPVNCCYQFGTKI